MELWWLLISRGLVSVEMAQIMVGSAYDFVLCVVLWETKCQGSTTILKSRKSKDELFCGGKWKTLRRKPKYGNRNAEVRRKAAYWFTNVPCRQRVTVSKQCESQVLIHRTPASNNTVVYHDTERVLLSWSRFETTPSC